MKYFEMTQEEDMRLSCKMIIDCANALYLYVVQAPKILINQLKF